MQIHELTTVNNAGLGSTEYLATDNTTATRKYNLSDLLIRAGDTLTIGNYAQVGGAWAGNTSLRFTVPVNKIIVADNAAFTSGTIYIKVTNSSGAVDLTGTGITVTVYIQPVGLTFKVDWSSAPSYAVSNAAASIQLSNVQVTFS